MIITPAERLGRIEEYYFSRKLQEVRQLAAEGLDVINLGIGNPDLPPAAETIAALDASARQPGHHGYQPYRGIAALREAMAGWYHRIYDVSLDAQHNILPLMGSKEGIFYLSMAFVNPGDGVLVPDPGYPGYAAAARIAGGRVLSYDLTEERRWFPDLAALAAQMDDSIKLMWVNYPHMPTGAVASRRQLQTLVDFARAHRILLCHDNPYSLIDTAEPLSIMALPGAQECAIELNSLSKGHRMAGWRVGMLIGDRTCIDNVLKVKSNVDSGMFRPLQDAAISALGHDLNWHQAQSRVYRQRKQLAFEIMALLGCSCSQEAAGMFVWGRAPAAIADVAAWLDDLLLNTGVFLAPGKVFGHNGERYVRLSVCAPESKLAAARERIAVFRAAPADKRQQAG